MSLTIMNFNHLRDLVSNLGCMNEENIYILSKDCLKTLENLEDQLSKEDVLNRNVRISLHIFRTVKDDLIPILIHGRDFKTLATATRVLVSLSLPVEYLLPMEDSLLTAKHLNVRKQLLLSSFAMKKVFLDAGATLSLVTMLRDVMIKSEKHDLPLKEEECEHLKNCLILLRNLLYLPENFSSMDKNCIPKYSEWHSIQNKLIWNLFVQGIDGALILMLNSAHREHWTIPMALIIALLFRNQNIGKVSRSLKMVSPASESSGESEESDTSNKCSSISLSSEPSKATDAFSDSGFPLTSESSEICFEETQSSEMKPSDENSLDIHKKLEKVQISDDSGNENNSIASSNSSNFRSSNMKIFSSPSNMLPYVDNDTESSSSSEYPYHKKVKANAPSDNNSPIEDSDIFSKHALSKDMECSLLDSKSSDEDNFNETRMVENLKAVQKLKSVQMLSKFSESDSSNEESQALRKHRNHPPTGRRGKNPRKDGCLPLICMEATESKRRLRFPLWEKRNSVTTMANETSTSPSDDEIGFLIKEFALSFLHSGFSDLIVKLKKLLLSGPHVSVDKSLLFWMISYFLQLASAVNLNLNHISAILSPDFVSFLVFECVNACENMEIHSNASETVKKYVTVYLNLLVSALKEVMITSDYYFKKPISVKDKVLFNELYGKLSECIDFRQIPLLLFNAYPTHKSKQYLEDVVVLNHHILLALERGSKHCWKFRSVNMISHLKQFAAKNVVQCYRRILENFKFNGYFLNECVFTLWHHLAGDIHLSQVLLEPSVLKVFSTILKEDIELNQYQEDLIMYILNKFSRQVQMKFLKEKRGQTKQSSDDSSSNSSLSNHCLLVEEDDDLFWWYLQFEQDKDPITRISEHVLTPKRDILNKLQLKGFISSEKLKTLENKMMASQDTDEVMISEDEISPFDDDITHLLRTLVQSGERQHLIWLQNTLLETCYVMLGTKTHTAESVPFYSHMLMLSAPLVPYTDEQRAILQNETFVKLLEKLGLHYDANKSHVYPRIPFSWTIDMVFSIAARLGPVRKEKMKFTHEELVESVPNHDPSTIRHIKCPDLPPLTSCNTLSSWITAVQLSKELYKDESGEDS